MVIENGEGEYALAIDFEIAFEVALPEFVRLSAFEALLGRRSSRGGLNALMAGEDVGDGANAW